MNINFTLKKQAQSLKIESALQKYFINSLSLALHLKEF